MSVAGEKCTFARVTNMYFSPVSVRSVMVMEMEMVVMEMEMELLMVLVLLLLLVESLALAGLRAAASPPPARETLAHPARAGERREVHLRTACERVLLASEPVSQ